ncbi:MAG: hypothetical protein QGH95_01095 [Candidatus Nitrosopelagicus sp.]|nr:hypothetical protein [Candidatus Nitrosopelagicus sp.]
MRKKLLSLGIVFGIMLVMPFASGQLFEKATFQESALVIYDQQYSNSVITSIGLETISNQEIKFTDELIKKINDNEKIRAIVFTNAGECVIGVTSEEQCIMINFDYQQLKGDGGIRMVQDSAREMGNEIIDQLNEELGVEGEFHSTFIHTVDDANLLLETSGVISGRGAVSATFTMPKQSTDFLFTDLAGTLIAKEIREGQGFYDISKKLSKNDGAIISVSIIKTGDENLFMFKVTNEIKDVADEISRINVLENFGVNEISRSDVFDGRNVPLNSVIQLVVIPSEPAKIDTIATHAITDLTTLENISKRGWFFSSPAGNSIDAKFLFGQSKVIPQDELRVEIGPWDGKSELSFYSVEDIPQDEKEYESKEDFGKKDSGEDQSQYAVLAIIIVIGIGAAIFYLKGYKPKR